jgi:hypothetical protein
MPDVMTKTASAMWMMALFLMAGPLAAQERYASANLGSDGAPRIVTETGAVIVPAPEPEIEFLGKQVGAEGLRISADGRAVGWVAMFANCCTSYPIPMALVVYSNGVKRAYTGNGYPVFAWCFREGSTQVAFEQEPVHGGFPIGYHWELRDVSTGAKIEDQFYEERSVDGPRDKPTWACSGP